MTDKYDEQAESLLPCQLLPGCYTASKLLHNYDCCAWKRPTVAAALREKDAEINQQKIVIEKLLHGNEKLREALADPPPDVQE